jgi:hypothetical protein
MHRSCSSRQSQPWANHKRQRPRKKRHRRPLCKIVKLLRHPCLSLSHRPSQLQQLQKSRLRRQRHRFVPRNKRQK